MIDSESLVYFDAKETWFPSPYAPKNMQSGQRSWYHQRIIGSRSLLITAGDSWTWGDSLNPGRTTGPLFREYNEHRLEHVYGTVLSRKLGTDHINLARSDASNLDILKYLARILPAVHDRYDRIFAVITLTENYRERLDIDPGTKHKTLTQYLRDLELAMLQQYLELLHSYPKLHSLLARNFTHSFDHDHAQLRKICVDQIWADVLAAEQNIGPYPNQLRILSMASYANLECHIDSVDSTLLDMWSPELEEMFCATIDANAWLEKSELNYKIATKHPNEHAHAIWADYLYQAIHDKYLV